MTIAQTLLPEFDQEMATTRRLLERVPSEKGQWKPHPKSFALGHLAQLVSSMPSWLTNIVQETALDLGTATPYSFEKTETLLERLNGRQVPARRSVEGTLVIRASTAPPRPAATAASLTTKGR